MHAAVIPSENRADESLLVADVGNSRIKLAAVVDRGVGSTGGAPRLPTVGRRLEVDSRSFRGAVLRDWLRLVAPGPATILVASVNDAAAAALEMALAEESASGHRTLRQRRIAQPDLPVGVAVDAPLAVGIDRLAAAAAAALVKRAGEGVIVVDCGTAATVDIVSADGRFLGGAILPGPALLARALSEGTSRLPSVEASRESDPPAMPGRNTRDAIAAGIGWGLRGAIAGLVHEARRATGAGTPVILTGGWSGSILPAVPGATEMPDLVLAGIAMAAGPAAGRWRE